MGKVLKGKVAIAVGSVEKLNALAEQLGDHALACATDVMDPDSVEALARTSLDRFGRIDILAYVTGTNIPDRSLEELSRETWDMMVATNLSGAFHCTRALVPAMRKQGAV